VLLVDADEDECVVLKRLMKREKIDVSIASDTRQMLSMFEELPFDGVIIAPPFSNADAPELIKTLRKRSGWSRLPVIVIAPEISEETLQEFNDMNRVKFLDMPLNYELLAQLLHSRL
jgi:DNA-binding NtrC family response regulator